jgi:xylulokinase
MTDAQLIGLDVGTTSCKGAVFGAQGELLALVTVPYDVSRPAPGWVEQPVEGYWNAAVRCLRELLAAPGVEPGQLAGLSSCGQAPTMVLLDAEGVPVRPAILWQDTRAAGEAEQLARDPGADVLAQWLGLRWPVDASLPLARLRWLQRHEPETLTRAAVTLQPKDFVHLRLTGQASTDTWSGKGLVHQVSRRPIPAVLNAAHGGSAGAGSADFVPPAHLAHEIVGRVTAEGAAVTGVPEGLPVIAGWTDAMAAMLGAGTFGRLGLACDVSGTSEVIGLCAALCPGDTAPLFMAPVLDAGRASLYGPTQSSGGSLGWALRTVGADSLSLDAALAVAAEVPPGADGIVFLPYLEGERAPVWDPRARGVLLGLSSSHGRAQLIRAVLEGVACSVRHILWTAEAMAAAPAEELRVAGGGARLALWNRIKADVTNRPVRPCAVTENGVLGAAMLAALGAGVHPDLAAAGDAMVRLEAPVLPDPAAHAAYARTYERYVALYPRLRDLFTA